ncbi:hypothetical protein WEB32_34650 [Streptomyces netropsis]|uniref:terpene synthase family protein n=1 Tax=Streptomyces netropsis TaxID=55404 RepID=UPI0030CFF136
MPQATDFFIPVVPRISPDVPQARRGTLSWVRERQLLPDETSLDRFASWDLAELAGRVSPRAVGEDLRTAADVQSFFFLFDDLFDTPIGDHPGRARVVCDEFTAVMHHLRPVPTASPPALLHAWADLWSRQTAGMSRAWRTRAAEVWETYFAGHVTEARHRLSRRPLGSQEYVLLRRQVVGADPTLIQCERAGHREIPDAVFHSTVFRTMRELTGDVAFLVNDVQSVEKEERQGELNNLVLIVERERACPRVTAIEAICDMVRQRIHHFSALERELDSLCDRLALPAGECAHVEDFVADAMWACMRGNYDWGRRTRRYAAP